MTIHLLAIETSSERCDIAVLSVQDDQQALVQRTTQGVSRHAEAMFPLVDAALREAGVDKQALTVVAFGQGPGSFTGLRVACGVTQGIAYGLGLPVVAVPSLLAVAEQAVHTQPALASRVPDTACVVMQDARMGEAYVAVYQPPAQPQQAWQAMVEPFLVDVEQIPQWLQQQLSQWGPEAASRLVFMGDALDAYPELQERLPGWAANQMGQSTRACAPSVARLALGAWQRGETLRPEQAMPLYVRDKVAFTIAERAQGAGGNPRAPDVAGHITPMTPAHLRAVAAIESQVQSFPWSLKNFADGLKAGYPAWVIYHQGRLVGYYMVMLAPDLAHLLVIGVHPEAQRQGLGSRLLAHCEALAREHGLATVVLEVRQSNQQAIQFYQQQGYTTFTTRPGYYPCAHGDREAANVMRKDFPQVTA